ncbi:hypothetical protein B0181_00775 [Moraxella caviae]|uniref:Uncharacterized protein n=1 Tax=Moraxella caviae TaxID=34060 RepID=A0A1T0AC51_9GAMM|nr:hypothetical protein [Moraxella caviae]OOR93209.1 hypothetical protein B0181_00775 [Moraxella caviae]STZ10481.1 Uncharacterised protein [Moraxella caviae]VEW12805.1 Uncharacterised protein [Moraxella caviae]
MQLKSLSDMPKTLDDLFADDDLGLFANVKAKNQTRSLSALAQKFLEITDFVEEKGREPNPQGDLSEKQLARSLDKIRSNEAQCKELAEFDRLQLLAGKPNALNQREEKTVAEAVMVEKVDAENPPAEEAIEEEIEKKIEEIIEARTLQNIATEKTVVEQVVQAVEKLENFADKQEKNDTSPNEAKITVTTPQSTSQWVENATHDSQNRPVMVQNKEEAQCPKSKRPFLTALMICLMMILLVYWIWAM